ncbi:MAG TPA: hypothetical protein VF629_12360 [Hymenobacter sp.]
MKTLQSATAFKLKKLVVTRFTATSTNAKHASSSIFTSSIISLSQAV